MGHVRSRMNRYQAERYARYRRDGFPPIMALCASLYGHAWPYVSAVFYDDVRSLADSIRPRGT